MLSSLSCLSCLFQHLETCTKIDEIFSRISPQYNTIEIDVAARGNLSSHVITILAM